MRALIAAIAILFASVSAANAQSSGNVRVIDPADAAAFIESIGAQAVQILRNQDITLEDREAQLRDIVEDSFNFRAIGRFALGSDTWDAASDAERTEYLYLFSTFLLQSYTRRFGGYSGQTLLINEARQHRDRDALVITTIETEGADSTDVTWLVRESEDGPRILDVIIDGTSMALTQKREFEAILAREQLTGLLELLRLRITRFSAES
ncbi:MAG: ABC transporter substrate-binding protein [Alphaproteobacteria bacterium]